MSIAEKTIKNMKDGQIGFTVPWDMWRDENGLFWLVGNSSLSDRPKGTVELRICKIGELYSVEISLCREIWERSTRKGKNIIPIPVYEIKFCGIAIWDKVTQIQKAT